MNGLIARSSQLIAFLKPYTMRLLISFVIVLVAGIIIKSEERKDLAELRNNKEADSTNMGMIKIKNYNESLDWIFFGRHMPVRILGEARIHTDATRVKRVY